MSRRLLFSLVGGLFLLATALFDASAAHAQAFKHPKIHQAIFEMEHAEVELSEAKNNFGGHKAKAIEALHAASKQLKLALDAVEDPYKGGFKAKNIGKEVGPFPKINKAIRELEAAEVYLKEANHDFKGHKEKAMKDIRFAIDELVAAEKFASKK